MLKFELPFVKLKDIRLLDCQQSWIVGDYNINTSVCEHFYIDVNMSNNVMKVDFPSPTRLFCESWGTYMDFWWPVSVLGEL